MTIEKEIKSRDFRTTELEFLAEFCRKHKLRELRYSAVGDLTIEMKFDENAFAEKLDDDMLKELIKKTSADDLLFASAN